MYKINEIKADDTKTSDTKEYPFFPEADRRLFPSRNPRATGWQIGLREEFGWDDGNKKDNNVVVVEEEDKSSPEYRHQRRVKLTRLLRRAQVVHKFQKESLFHIDNPIAKKKSTIILEKLPTVSKEQKQKYFGESSKKLFYDTYKDLKDKGQILTGGYEELEGIVQVPAEESVFLNPMGVLENSYYYDDNYNEDDFPRMDDLEIKDSPSFEASPKAFSPPSLSRSRSSRLSAKPLKLYDDVAELGPVDATFNQGSPRAIFLSGCLKLGIPPLTAAMLRKKINSTMNLAHMGIGRLSNYIQNSLSIIYNFIRHENILFFMSTLKVLCLIILI